MGRASALSFFEVLEMNARDKILDQIKKIVARTKEGANTSEAEVAQALEFARRLMDKHNISEAELYTSDAGGRTLLEQMCEREFYSRFGSVDLPDRILTQAVMIVTDTKVVIKDRFADNRKGVLRKRESFFYVGLQHDVEVACSLYSQLLITMRAMSRLRCGHDKWNKQRKSYAVGFADRLRARAAAYRRKHTQEAQTTAIVVRKEELIVQWMDQQYGDLDPDKERNMQIDADMFMQGADDANRIDLNLDPKLEK